MAPGTWWHLQGHLAGDSWPSKAQGGPFPVAIPIPVPSGVDLTKEGSIFTEAVGLVSAPSPFSISLRKRSDTSWRVSSESRMWYRYLST